MTPAPYFSEKKRRLIPHLQNKPSPISYLEMIIYADPVSSSMNSRHSIPTILYNQTVFPTWFLTYCWGDSPVICLNTLLKLPGELNPTS